MQAWSSILQTIVREGTPTVAMEVAMVSITVSPKMDVILICAGRMSACSLMEFMMK